MRDVWKAYTKRAVKRLERPVLDRLPGSKTQRGVVIVAILMLFGMLVVAVVLAEDAPKAVRGATVGLIAYLIFLAASAIGASLGFLFGLPRSRFADAAGQGSTPEATQSLSPSSHYLSNSNLIKVSDWLTTIFVGVTLVNLGMVAPAVRELGANLSEPLGGQKYSAMVGMTISIFGVLSGFILSYLWVSIRVRELLEDSERWADTEVVPQFVGRSILDAMAAASPVQLRLAPPPQSAVDAMVTGQVPPEGTHVRKGTVVRLET